MNYLKKFSKSSLSKIRITYGGEVFKFNLIEITTIKESTIDLELKRQPSYYGFCLLLQKKLTTEYERLRQRRKSLYGQLYFRAKEKVKAKSTGRFLSDDAAKAYVLKHPQYIEITTQCIEARDNADAMFSVIRAFEQRKDLMQTISSNKRKEF